MTRNEAIAAYRLLITRAVDALWFADAASFNEAAAPAVEAPTPTDWVASGTALLDALDAEEDRGWEASALCDLASSAFVGGASASDAWIIARAY